ncbi:MAG: hypothetical protein A2342_00790 [Gallionellales bacterium RIFOXYB12_FULL_54_9]|nr:MAG: hypothetical protein A2342_00790 [Gallionellales bacterium RIFOXYB12_FULL_54_9]
MKSFNSSVSAQPKSGKRDAHMMDFNSSISAQPKQAVAADMSSLDTSVSAQPKPVKVLPA